MSEKLQVLLILGVLFYFLIIVHLLKKQKLLLKYTLLWFITGIVMLLLAIFPEIMENIVNIAGIYDVTNGLFLIAIFFIIVILMSITSIVSGLRNQNKVLVQSLALIEKRVRELENDNL